VVEPPDQGQVLGAGEVLVDGRVLPGQADQPADRRGVADDVDTGDLGPPGVRPQQRGEDVHGRGLAGAVGAEQAQHRARLHLQRDAVEGADVLAVRLDEVLGDDRGTTHAGDRTDGARTAAATLAVYAAAAGRLP
jgi:hypothetical protein